MDKNKTYSENIIQAENSVIKRMYNMTMDDVNAHCRRNGMVMVRYMAIYLYQKLTEESQSDVCIHFKRDRSTIYHAIDTVKNEMQFNKKFRHDYEAFESNVLTLLENEEEDKESNWFPRAGYKYWTPSLVCGLFVPKEMIWDGTQSSIELYERGMLFRDKKEVNKMCASLNKVVRRRN